MGHVDNIRDSRSNIPELSDPKRKITGYVLASLITLACGYFIFEVLSSNSLTFKANWNMFKSPLGNLCMIIGFVLAMIWWGKFTHWSATPIVDTRDEYGNLIERKENYDVTEQMFAKWLLPLLGHFVIEPIMYGAIIYYPLQCIIAVVGSIFPYVLSLIVLGIIAGSWLLTRSFLFRNHSIVLIILGLFIIIVFSLGGYAISRNWFGNTIQMFENNTKSSETVSINDKNTDWEDAYVDGEEMEEDESSQFEGVGEEGLYGSLAEGSTTFIGNMAGNDIEFTITKTTDMGEVKAICKDVENGTTIKFIGESLPAQAGDITFYSQDDTDEWVLCLSGDIDNVSGTVTVGGKEQKIILKKK